VAADEGAPAGGAGEERGSGHEDSRESGDAWPLHRLYCREMRGRLAQLGERLPYKQEVGGSIPSPPIRATVEGLES
jgi:hypothetical protein